MDSALPESTVSYGLSPLFDLRHYATAPAQLSSWTAAAQVLRAPPSPTGVRGTLRT